MINAGLLGYFGGTLPSAQLAAAHEIAPWRGEPATVIDRSIGTICALGSAQAGVYGDVAAAIHGRIDNLDALAGELHVDPDDVCAVVVAAYESYGDEFARRLIGDFAILVLDTQRGVLVGARDWIGARPLFWGKRGDVIAFGSEVKQVVALLGVPFQLDHTMLQLYRDDGDLPLDATFASDCWAVMPSGQVVASLHGSPRAWRCAPRFEPINISLEEAVPKVLNLLETAISRRTAGGRLGSTISGGMDSTTLTAVAASLAQRGVGPRVAAGFTFVYPDFPTCDESQYASQVAEKWSIPWHPIVVPPSDLRDLVPQLLVTHDGPALPGIGLYRALISTAKAAEIQILLSGEGGDSWLEQRGDELELLLLRGDWFPLLHWATLYARRGRRLAVRQILTGSCGRLRGKRAEGMFEERSADRNGRLVLEALEREGMRQGIRVEFPFFDAELAACLSGLPVSLRSVPGQRKVVMREAARGLLPDTVRTRRSETYGDDYLSAGLNDGELRGKVLMERWREKYIRAAQQHWDSPKLPPVSSSRVIPLDVLPDR